MLNLKLKWMNISSLIWFTHLVHSFGSLISEWPSFVGARGPAVAMYGAGSEPRTLSLRRKEIILYVLILSCLSKLMLELQCTKWKYACTSVLLYLFSYHVLIFSIICHVSAIIFYVCPVAEEHDFLSYLTCKCIQIYKCAV